MFELDPLTDPRWSEVAAQHPQASVFHTVGWIRALQQTYGYEPVVVTTAAPGSEIASAIVFCKIRSWFSGTRWVSLPFSDHCEPLGTSNEIGQLLRTFSRQRATSKYIEIRSLGREGLEAGFCLGKEFALHTLDLRPELELIFQGFHKDCIQRKIRRAERERLEYREGGSEALLDDFFKLFLMTRRRHGIPPAPRAWFANLITYLANAAKLRLVYRQDRPVAGMLTLAHRECLVYKYGCSDAAENRLGGMPLLFWKAIQDAKQSGITRFDLGRSDLDALGLIKFKEHLGAKCQLISYATYPLQLAHAVWTSRIAAAVFRRLPDALLIGAGRLLYRHVG
jgi:lipid II:glycine glycyltransferase (peptidoglycan interpeptide bridge formation enzyme)